MNYSQEELDNAALADLLADARHAEKQAEDGPYYPEKGIDKESLLQYAVKCRLKAHKYLYGGAHAAVRDGEE